MQQFQVTSTNPLSKSTEYLVIGVYAKRKLPSIAEITNKASEGKLWSIIKKSAFSGDKGDTLLYYGLKGTKVSRVMLVGCGKRSDFNLDKACDIMKVIIGKLRTEKCQDAILSIPFNMVNNNNQAFYKFIRSLTITAISFSYSFNPYKNKPINQHTVRKLIFYIPSKSFTAIGKKAIHHGRAIGLGVSLTRNLSNLPGNVCTPTYLALQAKILSKKHRKIHTKILKKKEMEKLNMGALLSVSQGSKQPSKFIIMQYHGEKSSKKPIVFIGKGLTFDAGGISLKPSAGMEKMKYDMCGGAAVFGLLTVCAELALPINVIGLIPTTENLPDGNANRPGDIVTSMSGQTIEILNTDAEGRLILCDALTYAERFKPSIVIDIATLTGACVIALGHYASGLIANDDDLAAILIKAGKESGDRVWRLPLWDDYQEQICSKFADMKNIGDGSAGAITAGCFLARYAKKFKWAHLDIAGTSYTLGKNCEATGRPVPLLSDYLLRKAGSINL